MTRREGYIQRAGSPGIILGPMGCQGILSSSHLHEGLDHRRANSPLDRTSWKAQSGTHSYKFDSNLQEFLWHCKYSYICVDTALERFGACSQKGWQGGYFPYHISKSRHLKPRLSNKCSTIFAAYLGAHVADCESVHGRSQDAMSRRHFPIAHPRNLSAGLNVTWYAG